MIDVLDLTNNTIVNSISLGESSVNSNCIGITPDSSKVFIGYGKSTNITVINTSDDSVSKIDIGAYAAGISFSEDGSQAYVTAYTGDSLTNAAGKLIVINIDDAATPANYEKIEIGLGRGTAGFPVIYGNNLYTLYQNLSDYSINLMKVDLADSFSSTSAAIDYFPIAMTVNHDGSRLVIVTGLWTVKNSLTVVNTADLSAAAPIQCMLNVVAAGFSPDGSRLYVTKVAPTDSSDAYEDESSYVEIFDVSGDTYTSAGLVQVGKGAGSTGVSADGRYVYTLNTSANTVSVIDTVSKVVSNTVATANLSPQTLVSFICGGGRATDDTRISPKITWPKPSDIYIGTTLGSEQLNATADVPGSFSYTPDTGTVPGVGNNQLLRVVFTPDDTNYRPCRRIQLSPSQRSTIG